MSIRDARPKSKSKDNGLGGQIRANKVKMRSQDIEKGSSGVIPQDSCFVKMLGCNSIDIWNLRLELRRKLRQGLRTRLGRHRIGRRLRLGLRLGLRPSIMSIELHP